MCERVVRVREQVERRGMDGSGREMRTEKQEPHTMTWEITRLLQHFWEYLFYVLCMRVCELNQVSQQEFSELFLRKV